MKLVVMLLLSIREKKGDLTHFPHLVRTATASVCYRTYRCSFFGESRCLSRPLCPFLPRLWVPQGQPGMSGSHSQGSQPFE